ncbi:UTRA domain-containing protein [Nonomuraea sp. NPDC050310]|uniref:UTRA domain-containing protein n=1 Tax=Nonomuraea sp. NPDC050310 TaxID=3154935 RepID=UPI0033E35E79
MLQRRREVAADVEEHEVSAGGARLDVGQDVLGIGEGGPAEGVDLPRAADLAQGGLVDAARFGQDGDDVADAGDAGEEGLAAGDPVVIRDRVMGDPETGRVVQLATSYLPGDLAAGTVLAQADTGPGGIYDRMETDLGWGRLDWEGVITARAATPEETSLLQLAPGVPVLCVIRTTIATAGAAEGRDAGGFEVRYPIHRAT